jgi:protein-arginine kinase activator protein McsA
MTSEERRVLKELVDNAKRKRVTDPWEEFSCKGCRVGYNDFTNGCRTCAYRKHSRKIRGSTTSRNPWCAGCGVNFNEVTTGCSTCRERDKSRRRAMAA